MKREQNELARYAEREKGQRSYMRISKVSITFRLSESNVLAQIAEREE